MNFKIDADNDDSGTDTISMVAQLVQVMLDLIADNQNETGLQMYVDGTYRSHF